MHIVLSFFVFSVVILLVKCEDSCKVNRVHKGTVLTADHVPITNSPGHQTGTQVIYLQVDTTSSVESGSSLYIRCRDPFRFQGNPTLALGEITCTNGRWIPPPACLIPACGISSLNYPGLDKGEELTFFPGESFEPKCLHGYKVAEKPDKRIHCENGRWTGNLPPCTKEPQCKLPEKPEFGSLQLIGNSANVGSVVIFTCDEGRKLIGSVVSTCNDASEWTSPTPRCVESQCKLPEKPEFGSVELIGNSATVGSVVIFACDKGRKLIGSVFSTCNSFNEWTSPIPRCVAQCNTQALVNFEGLVVKSGLTLNDGEWFQSKCSEGFQIANQNDSKIYCRDGEWDGSVPPCSPLEKEPCLDMPPVPENGKIKTEWWGIEHGDIVRYECEPNYTMTESGNVVCSFGKWTGSPPICKEIGEPLVTPDSNSTENKKPVATDANVNPLCSCTYTVQSSVLVAHDGNKLVKYGDKIPNGSVIAFYCNSTGYFRLSGRPSIMCPEDCNWDHSLFPFCVSPADKDVYIRVLSSPSENMEVGLGGVLFVIPGTRLELTCRAKTGYKQFVNWTSPSDGGFYKPVTAGDRFRMHYIIPAASLRDSGTYTCFNQHGASHNLEVEVADKECPEMELTEELAISYVPPNRKSGSRATFHCFSPHTRNGPSFVTCKASGFWSEPPASCSLPMCSMESLFDVIPEGVVPVIQGNLSENVQFGHELRLGCDEVGRAVRGGNTAVCSEEGKWRAGDDIHCVQVCAGWQKKSGSTVLISPDKEFYDTGESIMLSCPEGKELTTDVRRIMCSRSGWKPNTIPDCQ